MSERKLTTEQEKMVKTLVKALPYLRKEIKVSQTELAEKIGISRQMLSLIEREEVALTWTTFLAIIFFFKCNEEFGKSNKRIATKYPSLVEQQLLLVNYLSKNNQEEAQHDR